MIMAADQQAIQSKPAITASIEKHFLDKEQEQYICSSEHDKILSFLEFLNNKVKCNWCKHPKENVLPRIGLCKHCNRIRKELNRLEREQRLGFTYEVVCRMKENAIAEGNIYGEIHIEITSLKLERELRLLGERFVKKEFFKSDANILAGVFCPIHRAYVYYMVSLYNREYMRKYRRQFAAYEYG
jgi:hypothetical protein